MKEKIVFLVHQSPFNELAGAQLYAHNLSRSLAAFFDITVIYPVPKFNESNRIWDQVSYRGITFEYDEFSEVLEIISPKYVSIHGLKGDSDFIFDVLKRQKIPYSITLHDFWYLCERRHLICSDTKFFICSGPDSAAKCFKCCKNEGAVGVSKTEAYFQERMEKYQAALQRAVFVHAPSSFVQSLYEKFYNADVRTFRLGLYSGREPIYKKAQSDPDQKLKIVFCGNLKKVKGIELLLEAFSNGFGEEKKISLHVYGEFPNKQYAKEVKSLCKNVANIKFHGRYSQRQLPKLFKGAYLCVIPSAVETYGLVLREAWKHGVPALCSRIDAFTEAAPEGHGVLYFEPFFSSDLQEKLEALIENHDLYESVRLRIPEPPSFEKDIKLYKERFEQYI